MAQDPEIMKIQPSDNPGMSLTSIPLDGSNFLTWSRSVKISLGAKMKLSFINGKIKKPEETDQTYEQWIRADYMVTSWILNSISKEIVESFLYTTTARELWIELETRFGQGNGPMIYQLKREISSIAQGTMSNGHTKEVCFEIYGYPVWYKNLVEQRKKDGANTSRAFVAANTQEQAQNAVDELTMSEMIRTEIQRLADGAKHPVKKTGDDHKIKRVVGVGKVIGRLYVLDSQSFKENTITQWLNTVKGVSLNVTTNNIDIWHRRLGHASTVVINHLTLSKNNKKEPGLCEICPQAKQQRLAFPVSESSSTSGFELVHADLWGPYNQYSLSNCTYMLTLVDDFSRCPKSQSQNWTNNKLQAYGFAQSKHDHCLFTKVTSSGLFTLLVYVDDVLITGSSEDIIKDIKVYLDKLFTIKDLGSVKYFLGLEIARSVAGIIITQTKYIKDIIADTGLSNAKAITTPLPVGIKFSAEAGNQVSNPETYRRLVGRLRYLGFTRPDISHASQQLSKFIHHPCKRHWDAALHLVKYLKGTPYKGLFFPTEQPLNLKAYSDADWAACVDTRRSLTGYCIFLDSALVS
ncbi:UNVERIFIED_CONTAM: Retrovirus-related Pol polyprotein from transposon RE1 [Sesamum latifolium]|uniref:Retrovirus-related Pol polyprotein from transposon RE1 n=1 Tax=Sesamum latifolium TaxID=2727402 RepID=A0AAW2VVL2_9LAMI